MSDEIQRQQAMILLDRAYKHQMRGELADAILLYKRSLQTFATAEAYTFLGWTYSMMDRYDEAIESCEKAIEVDPSFGNPYNDIGAYLIEMERWEEAIPWLEKATEATRYEAPQFPHMNLGRVYEHLGDYDRAMEYFNRAVEIDPFYRTAIWAKYELLARWN
ncbi:MAG TPA: tetratricopeptide repeat protein [Candidatus Binatia bacterium]|jgi:tetratricopeptide (TPR) repeat protein|nr:tetratricopeptide repeat protein [Candidatus Binatia bacterium]